VSPSLIHGLTYTRTHTQTTLHAQVLIQCQPCYHRSSGAAPNFTPATDPFLPVSHMPPQLLRFVRPPAQQTDDETSPHWHPHCSPAAPPPRKLVDPPNESAVDARLAPSLTNLFMRLRRRAHFLRPPPFLSLPAARRKSRLAAGLQRGDAGDRVYDGTTKDDLVKFQCQMTHWSSRIGSGEIPQW